MLAHLKMQRVFFSFTGLQNPAEEGLTLADRDPPDRDEQENDNYGQQ